MQQQQPPGVPPLSLTGERTLPDVPAENYWYRRHLAVYEWIGARVLGARVIDMACGEGYGSAVLARGARSVLGVDANPRPSSTPGGAIAPTTCASSEVWWRRMENLGATTPSCFCRRSSTSMIRCRCSRICERLLAPGGAVYVSTPNLLTIAPPGAEKSSNPWHLKEYRAHEFDALCRAVFDRVELLGLRHARRLRLHELALRGGWDAVHAHLGLTCWFYDRFTPAISARDFALAAPAWTGRWTSSRSATTPELPDDPFGERADLPTEYPSDHRGSRPPRRPRRRLRVRVGLCALLPHADRRAPHHPGRSRTPPPGMWGHTIARPARDQIDKVTDVRAGALPNASTTAVLLARRAAVRSPNSGTPGPQRARGRRRVTPR